MPEAQANPTLSSSVTSAKPGVLPEEAASLYREVLEAMNERGVPYAVAGAFALEKYTGIWRVTKDLDLFMKPDDVPAALGYLQEHGFRCEIPDPVWLAKAHRGEYFVDLISGMSNAVIVVDQSWMQRAQPAVIAGVDSRIISVEDLLSSKLFVIRRERFDGADIVHIIYRSRGKLDWERVLQLAGEHWEIVLWTLILFRYVYPAHTEYVPLTLWRDLLTRFVHELEHPNPKALFRGSLVDDNMFSIDMKDWGLEDLESDYRTRHLKRRPEEVRENMSAARKTGSQDK